MQPNTTQVPHYILREWLPRLKDVELRVLLIITDQTLGWLEDEKTKRRKERDWISRRQLETKTGRGKTQIAAAITKLTEYELIEALDDKSKPLKDGRQRQLAGSRIFYRLKTRETSLFDKAPVRKPDRGVSEIRPGQNSDTTKETPLTKEVTGTSATRAASSKPKKESPHKRVLAFFHDTVRAARGFKPVITAADGMRLKHALELGISPDTLEQAATFYLYDPSFKKFSPTLATFLSAGILNGLLNRMKNDADFWRNLDGYIRRRTASAKPLERDERKALIDDLAKLKSELAAKLGKPIISHEEAAELGVEQAKRERSLST